MSYGRMKQEEERLGREIDELMRQAEVADADQCVFLATKSFYDRIELPNSLGESHDY
jgi:hypothetical protein